MATSSCLALTAWPSSLTLITEYGWIMAWWMMGLLHIIWLYTIPCHDVSATLHWPQVMGQRVTSFYTDRRRIPSDIISLRQSLPCTRDGGKTYFILCIYQRNVCGLCNLWLQMDVDRQMVFPVVSACKMRLSPKWIGHLSPKEEQWQFDPAQAYQTPCWRPWPHLRLGSFFVYRRYWKML